MTSAYQEYLKSEVWQATRKEALTRAGHRCQLCGSKHAVLDVHHNNYANLGNEDDEDLVVLCRTCHFDFHRKPAVPDVGSLSEAGAHTIRSAEEHRALLLASMVAVCEGRMSVPQANSLVGLSCEVHKSIRQQWDMLVYADQHLQLGSGNKVLMIASGDEGDEDALQEEAA